MPDTHGRRGRRRREHAHAEETADLSRKAVVSLVLGVIAMIVSMPLMGGSGMAHHAPPADPLIRWTMRVIDPPMRAVVPALYAVDPSRSALRPAGGHAVRDGLGRAPLLRARVGGGEHGTADMNTLIAVGTGAAFLYSLAATLCAGQF